MPVRALQSAYPPLLLAKKLNNRAAFCIETGHYERAVPNLIRALKITEEIDNNEFCACKHCSLEDCMAFSQTRSGHNKSILSKSSTATKQLSDDVFSEEGYIHRQPIRLTPQSMQGEHFMGCALPLIVTFNLALAHHLITISETTLDRSKLGNVLKLYELAYRWQLEEDDESVDCIRFTMIISNNLGEIHRAANNKSKYERCLQHLLSTMMFVIDCQQNSDQTLELDGFLLNASQLFVRDQCAASA